jgi:hypothetical protein
MNRVFKTLLLWLLIAVLPVQGFAAAMKASCGPGRHGSLPISITTDEHHHDGAAAHAHHHDADMHSVSDSSPPESSVTADNSSDTHKHKSSYCSACAACCAGAVAPPSALHRTPVHGSSELVLASPAPLVTGYIPGGLERPPRRIFA